MAQIYPKWPKIDARIYALFPQLFLTEKAVPQTFLLLECMIEVQLDKYVLAFSPADQMSPEICPENKFSPPGNHRLLSAVQNRPMCDFLDHFI